MGVGNRKSVCDEIIVPILISLHFQLQACFLVADDIMDSSLTRRGRPCWYKVVSKRSWFAAVSEVKRPDFQPSVGMNAVNDTILLENSIYILVKDTLPDEKLRNTVLSLVAEVSPSCFSSSHKIQNKVF